MSGDQQKFKSYAITIRPRNGIDEDQLPLVTDWIKKRCSHYHIVTEKEGSARHLHAAMYLLTPVKRSNMTVVLGRLGKKIGMDAEEICVMNRGVRILYSNDFVTNYLDKDDDTVVIASCLPEMGSLNSFYPPKPVADVNQRKVAKHSKYYWELEKLWYEHKRPIDEPNTQNMRNFLFDMMYNKRLIPVIKDDKSILQVSRHLTRWVKKVDESTLELAPFEKEE